MKTKAAIAVALFGSAVLGASFVGWSAAQSGSDKEEAASSPARELETAFTDAEEDDIRAIVRNYLMDNPEVIIEAVNAFSARKQVAEIEQARNGAKDNLDALLDPKTAYVAGADVDNARVAVIELFDYHCGACKSAAGSIKDFANEDADVKVVFRELPMLQRESETAAEMSLAAREQDKFLDFHFAMMGTAGTLTKDRIASIAKAQGLDADQLERDSANPQVAEAIYQNLDLAESMGAFSTPTFIIAAVDGSYLEVMKGYHSETLKRYVEAAKAATSGDAP